MDGLWDYKTRVLNMREEIELFRWTEDNRECIHLFEEGPMEGMYYYDGVYRVVINNIYDAVWFRLKFC
jgi:hypothetical protein